MPSKLTDIDAEWCPNDIEKRRVRLGHNVARSSRIQPFEDSCHQPAYMFALAARCWNQRMEPKPPGFELEPEAPWHERPEPHLFAGVAATAVRVPGRNRSPCKPPSGERPSACRSKSLELSSWHRDHNPDTPDNAGTGAAPCVRESPLRSHRIVREAFWAAAKRDVGRGRS